MIDSREAMRKITLGMLGYSGLAALARPWAGGIGAILMLHRVTAAAPREAALNAALAITPGFLDALIQDMKGTGYRFVSMDQAVERIGGAGEGEKFAALTADDGYRDNLVEALPVLRKHGAPITIYIAPALISGETLPWWDVVAACVEACDRLSLPGGEALDSATSRLKRQAYARIHAFLATSVAEADQAAMLRELAAQAGIDAEQTRRALFVDRDELRRLAAEPLVTIGAHTVHHYSLARLPAERAAEEIAESGQWLRRELGVPARHFAYPYGHPAAAGRREADLAAKAGYLSAVTTRHGLLHPGHAKEMHALPRISVDGRFQRLAYLSPMLAGITTPLANGGKRLVTV